MEKKQSNTQSNGKRKWLRRLATLLFLVLTFNPCSYYLVIGGLATIQDIFIQYRFSRPLFEYPLPETTYEIGRETSLFGYGTKGCGFTATRLVKSKLSHSELITYFWDVRFPTPHFDSNDYHEDGLVRVRVNEEDNHFRLSISGSGYFRDHFGSTNCSR